MYEFCLEIDMDHSAELERLLKQGGAEYRLYLRKEVDIPQLIMVTAASLQILDILIRWYMKTRKKAPGVKLKLYQYDQTAFDFMGQEIKNFESKSMKEIEMIIGGE